MASGHIAFKNSILNYIVSNNTSCLYGVIGPCRRIVTLDFRDISLWLCKKQANSSFNRQSIS